MMAKFAVDAYSGQTEGEIRQRKRVRGREKERIFFVITRKVLEPGQGSSLAGRHHGG